jgi:methionine-gamma-lyase
MGGVGGVRRSNRAINRITPNNRYITTTSTTTTTNSLFEQHPQTIAIHAGETSLDPATRASAPPLVLSTTFGVAEPLSFSGSELTEQDPWCYTRWGNPTVRQLEHKLAALEGVGPEEHAVAFASGMAASTALLFTLLQSGDHIVVADCQYPGVAELCKYTMPRFGIECTSVDTSDTAVSWLVLWLV